MGDVIDKVQTHLPQYIIVNDVHDFELAQTVNSMIEQGWRPLGGPIYRGMGITQRWHQALIRNYRQPPDWR